MTPILKVLSTSLAALAFLAFSLHLACAADSVTGAESRAPEDQPISLSVQNEPLGQVLKKIETDTGLSFSIDGDWKNIPVSVTLHQTPLHKSLKRILANLNNVVIYEEDNRVKIIILGKIEPGKAGSGPPIYQPAPVYQQPGPEAEPEPTEQSEPSVLPQEPEPIPEVKEEADTAETGNGETTGENAVEGQDATQAAEENIPGGDEPETPEKPAE